MKKKKINIQRVRETDQIWWNFVCYCSYFDHHHHHRGISYYYLMQSPKIYFNIDSVCDINYKSWHMRYAYAKSTYRRPSFTIFQFFDFIELFNMFYILWDMTAIPNWLCNLMKLNWSYIPLYSHGIYIYVFYLVSSSSSFTLTVLFLFFFFSHLQAAFFPLIDLNEQYKYHYYLKKINIRLLLNDHVAVEYFYCI